MTIGRYAHKYVIKYRHQFPVDAEDIPIRTSQTD
jgi:hypothetical protein